MTLNGTAVNVQFTQYALKRSIFKERTEPQVFRAKTGLLNDHRRLTTTRAHFMKRLSWYDPQNAFKICFRKQSSKHLHSSSSRSNQIISLIDDHDEAGRRIREPAHICITIGTHFFQVNNGSKTKTIRRKGERIIQNTFESDPSQHSKWAWPWPCILSFKLRVSDVSRKCVSKALIFELRFEQKQ